MRWPLGRARSRTSREELIAHLRGPQPRYDDEHDGLVVGHKSAVRASLAGADLHDTDLDHADLRHCNLRGANLAGSRLDGADLTWAILSKANLEGVHFGGARLVETMLDGADLSGADLSSVTGLTWAAVKGAKTTPATRWPAGFDPRKPDVAGPLLHGATKPRT